MKLNKLWASALALLALASCSKDLEPSANIIEPGEPAKTQLVHMDIKVTQDDNALRVGYGVSDDESGALTGLAMVEKNVNLRIAVKQGLNGTPEIDTYPFNKVQGANLATFSGSIRIPVKSGDEPYYMAAVLVSEGTQGQADYHEYATVDNEGATTVSIESNKNNKLLQPDAENKIYPNIPYRSRWTEVTMNTEGTAISRASIKLQPLGTLLRFRIHNMTVKQQTVHQLAFVFPTYTNRGEIDFLQTDDDNFPRWLGGSGGTGYPQTLPATITLEPNQKSNWYYIWVKGYTYTKDIRPQPLLVHYRSKPGEQYFEAPIFKTRKPLHEGSVKVTFKIRDGVDAEVDDLGDAGDWETADEIYDWPGTVLSRLSTGVVNTTEKGFVSVQVHNLNVRDRSVGYFTFADAVKKFKSPVRISLNGINRKYSLPTANEMKSIFPASVMPVTNYLVRMDMEGRTLLNVLERDITINGETLDFRGDYKNVASKKATYAIRFKDSSNKYRTAFKYTLEGDDNNRFMRVRARHLGNKSEFASVTLGQLEQDTFWNDPSTYDERIFPYYGNGSEDSDEGYNTGGKFFTSSLRSAEMVDWLSCSVRWGSLVEPTALSTKTYPVFLFERR